MTSLRARFQSSVELLARCKDVLDERPAEGLAQQDAAAPVTSAVLARRSWQDALLALSDDALDALEARGHEAPLPAKLPASLAAELEAARVLCALPLLSEGPPEPHDGARARRHETPRKQVQIDAFARLLAPLLSSADAHITRVVDVGSGHGHLTRAIASRLASSTGVRVIGLERDAALTARARALAQLHGVAQAVTFARTDVVRERLALSARDCVIGLHACGELSDALVEQGARAGASVVLVGCCLQKRRDATRAPLVAGGVALARERLGLSNLTLRDDGVEASRADNLAARARRLALSLLLARAGAPVSHGAEMSGLNRRAAHDALAVLVARAFALRGLTAPSARAIDDAHAWALAQHARLRRLQLPRTMLARVLEVHVALDRALYLEERGHEVTVGVAFPASASARNLAVVARAPLGVTHRS